MVQAVGLVRFGSPRFGKVTIDESVKKIHGNDNYVRLKDKINSPLSYEQVFDIFERQGINIELTSEKSRGFPNIAIIARNFRDTDIENPKGKIIHRDIVGAVHSFYNSDYMTEVISRVFKVAAIASQKLFEERERF